ncbi:hypothetical protein X777_11300 [Ooceraea biroi]|uniref:DUF4817 domain-containing protein n=1 Tax=Ooceraea biroi TaxID=2015173 RepID=A0A026W5H9_OOCBI|nr:hypothetical protein X777_11300 [Ooceraea biroi]
MPFSFEELADIHFLYGRANGNALAAWRFYATAFPNRRLPHHTTFTRIHQQLRENGKFEACRNNSGRDRVVRRPQIEEQILNSFEESASTSTRQIANTLQVSKLTIWRVLHDNQYYL